MTYPSGVSFIIPAFNEEKSIQNCIGAIQAEIHRQAFPDRFEIIVVDNASTDETAQRALQAGASVVFEKTKGIVHARNAGSRQARYRYLANIDADNCIPEGWLNVALAEMRDHAVAVVTGPLVYADVPRYVNIGASVFYFVARFFHHTVGPTVQGGNYMIRHTVFDNMGGYDTKFEFYGEDTATAQAAAPFGKIKLVPKMWIDASPRRMKAEGVLKTVWTYTLNYFWVSILGRRATEDYEDHR